jgi:hypothetical protein
MDDGDAPFENVVGLVITGRARSTTVHQPLSEAPVSERRLQGHRHQSNPRFIAEAPPRFRASPQPPSRAA